MRIGDSAGSFVKLSFRISPFSLPPGAGVWVGGGVLLASASVFFSTNFTLGGVMVNDNCSITSCPRNRTKMTFTFEEDFNLWFFFSLNNSLFFFL